MNLSHLKTPAGPVELISIGGTGLYGSREQGLSGRHVSEPLMQMTHVTQKNVALALTVHPPNGSDMHFMHRLDRLPPYAEARCASHSCPTGLRPALAGYWTNGAEIAHLLGVIQQVERS